MSATFLKLWTIQTVEFYEHLLKHKRITVAQQFINPDFKDAYDWMVKKMNQMLGSNHTDIYPIWAWYQYQSIFRKKPRLTDEALLPKGTNGVRLLIIKPKNEVVLSDFDLWHYVLNKWFINTGGPEDIETERQLNHYQKDFEQLPDYLKQKVIKSWDLIFDIDLKIKDLTFPKYKKSIQATFWELHLDEVKKVDFFVAK